MDGAEVTFTAGFAVKDLILPYERMEMSIKPALTFRHLRSKTIGHLVFKTAADAGLASGAVRLAAILYHHKLPDSITVTNRTLRLEDDTSTMDAFMHERYAGLESYSYVLRPVSHEEISQKLQDKVEDDLFE
jgi:hypothetical protein